jgi:hypothetical protein
MSNPFNEDHSNPFANSSKPTIAEYDPFQGQQTGYNNNNQKYVPPSVPSAPNSVNSNDAEVQALRKQVQDLQSQLEYKNRKIQETEVKLRLPNWPKWPKPFIYHDIESDITEPEPKKMVKKAYFTWFLTVFCTTWNMICLFMVIFVKSISQQQSVASNFGASLFFWLFWVPLSFILWYQPLYNAARLNRSASYVWFIITFAIHIGVAILYVLGIWTTGSAGILSCIDLFSQGEVGVGVCFLIATASWGLLALFSIYVMKEVIRNYRNHGHTIEKAKGEMKTAIGKEVIDVATTQAIAQATNPQK